MEELLNKLIKKGWKPFENNDVIRVKYGYSVHFLCRPIVNFLLDGYAEATVPLKEILTSKESGLWQFVCEEGLVNYNEMKRVEYMHQGNKDYEQREYYNGWDDGSPKYEYRLIESALCDEDKLEEFLLNNIKV